MAGTPKSSGKRLVDAQLFAEAKDFAGIELELALTFIRLTHTRRAMGNIAAADSSRDNAKKAYQSALKYCRKFKLSNPASPDHLKLTNLLSEVKGLFTASNAAYPRPTNEVDPRLALAPA
jgi:hypothetical protein